MDIFSPRCRFMAVLAAVLTLCQATMSVAAEAAAPSGAAADGEPAKPAKPVKQHPERPVNLRPLNKTKILDLRLISEEFVKRFEDDVRYLPGDVAIGFATAWRKNGHIATLLKNPPVVAALTTGQVDPAKLQPLNPVQLRRLDIAARKSTADFWRAIEEYGLAGPEATEETLPRRLEAYRQGAEKARERQEKREEIKEQAARRRELQQKDREKEDAKQKKIRDRERKEREERERRQKLYGPKNRAKSHG